MGLIPSNEVDDIRQDWPHLVPKLDHRRSHREVEKLTPKQSLSQEKEPRRMFGYM